MDEVVLSVTGAMSQYHKSDEAASAPFILITYAQSVDGSLSASKGSSTAISCPETLRMTHALRTHVDAILVGADTVASDNPSLTARLVHGRNPQPVVLDPDLAISLDSKLMSIAGGTRPILLTIDRSQGPKDRANRAARRKQLEEAGAKVVDVPGLKLHPRGHMDLRAGMSLLLHRFSIRTVMVEGGARVLSSFLLQHQGWDELHVMGQAQVCTPLAHCAVVTVAPMLLPAGVHMHGVSAATSPLKLENATWKLVGTDMVLTGLLPGPVPG